MKFQRSWIMRKSVAALFLVSVLLVASTSASAPEADAQAADQSALMPFVGSSAPTSYHAYFALDFAIDAGTPLHASGSGTVQTVPSAGNCNPLLNGGTPLNLQPGVDACVALGFGGGNTISITHADGTVSRYLHLQSFAPGLGSTVEPGEFIGLSGNTGISTGPHLHYEERDANNNYKQVGVMRGCVGGGEVSYPNVTAASGTITNDGYGCLDLGSPTDSDNDGVPDDEDRCDDTDVSETVTLDGCIQRWDHVSLDFDGDGRSDVFSKNGSQWRYRNGGVGGWINLASSAAALEELRFGDFDGDGRTDIFLQEADGNWRVSWAGTSAWDDTSLANSTALLRFGDFDGDGRTDVFTRRTDNNEWRVSWAGATAWDDNSLAGSSVPLKDLRFGDFDGDGRTDVFYQQRDGNWRVSWGGASAWDDTSLANSTADLRFADFDGDGRTDVFTKRTDNNQWRVSWGGATTWDDSVLNSASVPFGDLRFGDHDGDGDSDVTYFTGAGLYRYSRSGVAAWGALATFTEQPHELVTLPFPPERYGIALPRCAAGGSGDFDGDGIADIGIGSPGESLGSPIQRAAGSTVVAFGAADGVLAAGSRSPQAWNQDSEGIAGGIERFDRLGVLVASGDFNGDGFSDFVMSVPNENIGALDDSGIVQVVYGSANGPSANGSIPDQFWSQGSPSVEGGEEAGDLFGAALSTGDFNGDGFADLAVGVPGEDLGSPVIRDAGSVNVIYGSASGLSATVVADQVWSQDSGGVEGGIERGDRFGSSLSSGDFNGDGFADVAIGVPGEDLGSPVIRNAGSVNVIYGSASGLSATFFADQVWSQDSTGVSGGIERADAFGSTVGVCDANGDGFSDLLVGVPKEDHDSPTKIDAGWVHIIYGSSAGVSTGAVLSELVIAEGSPNVPGSVESGDHFGQSIASCTSAIETYPLTCNGLPVTVDLGLGEVPTAGDDVILGTGGADTINALAGDDVICGLGGDDVLNGGNGEDTIFGGEGDDRISGQGGVDTIFGEGGNDLINGGVGADVIHGGDGDDDLRGQGGQDTLNGDGGVDQFFGGSGNDVINTGEGGNAGTSQVVRGQSNNDTITGSSGADVLEGGPGLDIINGGDGGDTLKGGFGSDQLFGDGGDDLLEGGATRDFLYGGDGDDILKGGTGDDDLFGEAGSDSLDGQGNADLCDGGADVDTASATCETLVDIP